MPEYLDFIADGENYITAGDQFRVSGSGTGTHFPIIFYNTDSERHALNKQLTNPRTVNGVLRDGTSMLHPVIVIEYTSVPSFNYAYIEKFKRYYYVTDVGSVVNNIWAITLDVDVLMSFGTQIRTCSAMVERNEYYYYLNLPDTHREAKITKSYSFRFVSGGTAFDPTVIQKSTPSYLLIITATPSITDTAAPFPDISPLIRPTGCAGGNVSGVRMYALTPESVYYLFSWLYDTGLSDWNTLFQKLFNSPIEALVGLIQYPFDIVNHDRDRAIGPQDIAYGNGVPITIYPAYELRYDYDTVFDLGLFSTSKLYDDWRNYSPYSRWHIYLPYCGWYDLDPCRFLNASTLKIKYVIEMQTGRCKAHVIADRSLDLFDEIILTAEGEIGVKVPMSSSNVEEVARNAIATSANILNNMVSSAAKRDWIGMAGDAIQGALSIAMNPPAFSGAASTGTTGRFSPYRPRIIIESADFTDEGPNYAHLEGRPLHETVGLSSLSGFTVCSSVDLAGVTATKPELDQIEADLKGGVIL